MAAARAAHGVEVTILRLLRAEAGRATRGGPVNAIWRRSSSRRQQRSLPGRATPMADEPLRVHYARPGGPGDDLRWADSVLAERGTPRTGPAEQVKTWNLSSLWRLPIGSSAAWLKAVPPFFAHEPDARSARHGGRAASGRRRRTADAAGRHSRSRPAPHRRCAHAGDGEALGRAAGRVGRPLGRAPRTRPAGLAVGTARRGGRRRRRSYCTRAEREVVQQLERLLDGFAQRSAEVESAGFRSHSSTATSTAATCAGRRSGWCSSTGATAASVTRCWIRSPSSSTCRSVSMRRYWEWSRLWRAAGAGLY